VTSWDFLRSHQLCKIQLHTPPQIIFSEHFFKYRSASTAQSETAPGAADLQQPIKTPADNRTHIPGALRVEHKSSHVTAQVLKPQRCNAACFQIQNGMRLKLDEVVTPVKSPPVSHFGFGNRKLQLATGVPRYFNIVRRLNLRIPRCLRITTQSLRRND